MDFHSFCQKIDVDNIRAKFPPLPAMPSIPQLKLPRSMPKIKSRKIFRSSRENINRNDSSPKQQQQHQQQMGSQTQLSAYPPMPPASFIKQTPTRISTISSLVHHHHDHHYDHHHSTADGSTYRSAGSIDDDFPIQRRYSCGGGGVDGDDDMQISTLNTNSTITPNNNQSRLSFTEKLHRSYKDLTEFRLKHIFAKKTIIRKDNIQVEHYVEHYEEDLRREAKEQEKRDHAIADNYTFRFKLSQQNLEHSNEVTPDDSPRSEPIINKRRPIGRTVGELSGDESGMEATPPPRKPGIASTRFARVRSPPLRQSSSEQEADFDVEGKAEAKEEKFKLPDPIPSSLWSTKMNRTNVDAGNDTESENEVNEETSKPSTTKTKFSYKDRMRRLTSYMSTEKDTTTAAREEAITSNEALNKGSTKILTKIKNFGKRQESTTTETEMKSSSKQKATNSPQSTDEEQTQSPKIQSKGSPTARTFDAIKQNFKRFQQSIKAARQQQQTTHEETVDENEENKTSTTKTENLKTRLRRFRSRDVSTVDLEDEEEGTTTKKETQSPIRQAITNKLENWKKSFRRKGEDNKEETQTSGGETSPEKDKEKKEKQTKQKRSDTLIKRIKHIRARKNPDSKDELEEGNTDAEATEEQENYKPNKFTEARQRTLKKVNEKMQQLNFFHKSQEQPSESKPKSKGKGKRTTKETKYHSEEEDWDESPEDDHEPTPTPNKHNLPPTITRRDFPAPNESNPTNAVYLEPLSHIDRTFNIPTARAVWTSKPPALSESMESDADASEFPRVLIHQDNSDSFESTLIIAVTRSPSTIGSTSPRITEITNEKDLKKFMQEEKEEEEQEERTKKPKKPVRPKEQTEWIPNKNIIAGFLETTPPGGGKKKTPIKQERRRRSMDSNSNSDTENSRRNSQTGLISIVEERNEAWKIKTEIKGESHNAMLYKSKSIDIFEKNILKGGALAAFEDFDEELRNEPVLKITTEIGNADSYERESSEDTADDDNSSRITKISMNQFKENNNAEKIKEIKEIHEVTTTMQQQYGNSRESLIANFDENEEIENSTTDENTDNAENIDEVDDDIDKRDTSSSDDDDRPPSAAPSPPPKMSPPPPPLPIRQASLREPIKQPPPPLPKSKPPLPPPIIGKRKIGAPQPPPPRIPERSTSMPRAPKPLVKTSSLRLVFSEQVKPSDIGKVNKLISRFEPLENHTSQRPPRVISRRIQQQDDSEDYSDDEEDLIAMANKLKERYANIKIDRDTTPTPTNTPKINTPEIIESPKKFENEIKDESTTATATTTIRIKRDIIAPMVVTTTDEDNNTKILMQHVVEVVQNPQQQQQVLDLTTTTTTSDTNSNYSYSNSEYGSPLEYPSSLRSSMETIPILEKQKDGNGNQIRITKSNIERQFVRSRRSMPRDDDNYYSFDSDEENSYYSISSTGSNRYVVEL